MACSFVFRISNLGGERQYYTFYVLPPIISNANGDYLRVETRLLKVIRLDPMETGVVEVLKGFGLCKSFKRGKKKWGERDLTLITLPTSLPRYLSTYLLGISIHIAFYIACYSFFFFSLIHTSSVMSLLTQDSKTWVGRGRRCQSPKRNQKTWNIRPSHAAGRLSR